MASKRTMNPHSGIQQKGNKTNTRLSVSLMHSVDERRQDNTVYTMWFCLHRVREQAELIYGEEIRTEVPLWVLPGQGPWGAGDAVSLVLNGDCMTVHVRRNSSSCKHVTVFKGCFEKKVKKTNK